MKNIYKKIHLLSVLIAGSCLLQSPLNALNREEYNQKHPAPATTTVPTATPKGTTTRRTSRPPMSTHSTTECTMSDSDINLAAQNLIAIMGLKSMAELALIAYGTQDIKAETEPTTDSRKKAESAIADFTKNEFPKIDWNKIVKPQEKIAQFSSRKYAISTAFAKILKEQDFAVALKKVATTHYKQHEFFYTEEAKIVDPEILYTNIMKAIPGLDFEAVLNLDDENLGEILVFALSVPEKGATNEKKARAFAAFYKSLLNMTFTSFGKSAPSEVFYKKHAIPLIILGVTVLAVGGYLWWIGKKGRDNLYSKIKSKTTQLQDKAGKFAQSAKTRAGELATSAKNRAQSFASGIQEKTSQAKQWFSGLFGRKQNEIHFGRPANALTRSMINEASMAPERERQSIANEYRKTYDDYGSVVAADETAENQRQSMVEKSNRRLAKYGAR